MVQPKRIVGTLVLLTALLVWAPTMAAEGKAVVNINTADAEALMLLPRIGPTVAQRIVEFREKNGRFKAAEDLMLVEILALGGRPIGSRGISPSHCET